MMERKKYGMNVKYEDEALMFKALCDANRLTILEALQDGDKCACILLEDLNISQSTLSHHMKILCDAGFVHSHKKGKWMHYTLNEDGFEQAKDFLIKLQKSMI